MREKKKTSLQITCKFTSKLGVAPSFFQSCDFIFSFVEPLCLFQTPAK